VTAKYIIHTNPVPNRFKAPTKSGIIAWEEGCLRCPVCVKEQCVYGVYENRSLDPEQMIDSIDNQCMNCLRCVQGCPKELIHKSFNPHYKALGDSHWTPDVIASLWCQAETGKIPVSGAGYPGPFSGPGFDSMWTDMSEIVRPTRDGIHGREYISTGINIGGAPDHLSFTASGELEDSSPFPAEIPLPIILSLPPIGSWGESTVKGWAMAARELGTFLSLPHDMIKGDLVSLKESLIPVVDNGQPGSLKEMEGFTLLEVPWREDWKEIRERIKERNPSTLISWRIPLVKEAAEKILCLVNSGASAFYLKGTENGRHVDNDTAFIKEAIRSIHATLVEKGIRDKVTLLVGGGLAMAEHVAKSIICGADGVVIDLPILIALECRMCRRCTKGLPCPVEISRAEPSWVAGRVTNLMGAWHNQLLEVMGAMGIRDVRRLRGETGRAMFYEDLDRSTFGSLGTLREGYELE